MEQIIERYQKVTGTRIPEHDNRVRFIVFFFLGGTKLINYLGSMQHLVPKLNNFPNLIPKFGLRLIVPIRLN